MSSRTSRHRDILIGSIAATIATAITYLAYMAQFAAIFGGGGGGDRERGGNPLGLLVMAIVAPLAATVIRLAISRTREYGADQGGAEICGNPIVLANALRKLGAASGQDTSQGERAGRRQHIPYAYREPSVRQGTVFIYSALIRLWKRG